MAPGTIVITVILVFEFLEKDEEFAVFFVALIDVSGKAAEDGDEHESVGDGGAGQFDRRAGNQRSQQ